MSAIATATDLRLHVGSLNAASEELSAPTALPKSSPPTTQRRLIGSRLAPACAATETRLRVVDVVALVRGIRKSANRREAPRSAGVGDCGTGEGDSRLVSSHGRDSWQYRGCGDRDGDARVWIPAQSTV
jgi:hypothetical protein